MKTKISIHGTDFFINDRITYKGRIHNGRRIEGLLLNSRMVQAIFDDENPDTQTYWQYPDTKNWDPERNTNEFCAALPIYQGYGLMAVTVGLQGGGPIYHPDVYDNYCNSAFEWDGSLKPSYFQRLERILSTADDLGLVVIVNYFYWQQNRHFRDDQAIKGILLRGKDVHEKNPFVLKTKSDRILRYLSEHSEEVDALIRDLPGYIGPRKQGEQ